MIFIFFTGRDVLAKDVTGKEVEIEGVAAPPLEEVVVLNPEQSAQELVSILIDELQKYENRHQCSSLHYTYIGSFFINILVCGRYLFSKSCTSNTHTCTPAHPHNYTHTPPTYTPHTPTHTHTHTYTHTHTHTYTHTLTCTHAQVRLPTHGLSLHR